MHTLTIVRNAIKTPDGTILRSRSLYDYQSHLDTVSGETYGVVGGNKYLSHSVNVVPFVDMTVTSEDSFDVQREAFEWHNITEDGTEYIKLMDLSSIHLYAILTTQTKLDGTYTEYLLKEEVVNRLLNKQGVSNGRN
jgi:hypothetical protein